MNANYSHKRNATTNPDTRKPRGENRRTRTEVESMLRELAFVLKMTQRVRTEMEAEREATVGA